VLPAHGAQRVAGLQALARLIADAIEGSGQPPRSDERRPSSRRIATEDCAAAHSIGETDPSQKGEPSSVRPH
jgi:hypothetical protein